MEIYTLDSQLRRSEIIDRYESFIWSERFTAYGDCELVIHSTPENRNRLKVGTRLVIDASNYIMEIDEVETRRDAEGNRTLTARGKTLEAVMERRSIRRPMLDGSPVAEKIGRRREPAEIMRYYFNVHCRSNDMYPADNIPFLQPGTFYPLGTEPEPDEVISVEYSMGYLYDELKKIADAYSLGFRLVRNGDNSELYFEIYTGTNRTSTQRSNNSVIFSEDFDTLQDMTEYTSVENYRNIAFVFARNASRVVFASSANPSTKGFDRRVVYVDATDVDEPAGSALDELLEQRGREALSESQALQAFDGEVPQNSPYVYNVDYWLGDLVEMIGPEGTGNQMRVAEQIFISDAEGDRSYPTLSVDLYITAGSWRSWDYNETWDDVDPDLDWHDLPE